MPAMTLDGSKFFMLSGFALAAYSIVANDVIQTLGTFLSSNRKTRWWVLWLYAAGILGAVLLYGWFSNAGDPSYGRLSLISLPDQFHWWRLAPPMMLLLLTRFGFPVSTTFLILSIFSTHEVMAAIIVKSVLGYGVAFASAILSYWFVVNQIESRFLSIITSYGRCCSGCRQAFSGASG